MPMKPRDRFFWLFQHDTTGTIPQNHPTLQGTERKHIPPFTGSWENQRLKRAGWKPCYSPGRYPSVDNRKYCICQRSWFISWTPLYGCEKVRWVSFQNNNLNIFLRSGYLQFGCSKVDTFTALKMNIEPQRPPNWKFNHLPSTSLFGFPAVKWV